MEGRQQLELGIVLSGGAIRGVAHIGVLRALADHGIAPQIVAGASAGAIVGALYAGGYTPAAMLDFFHAKNPFRLSKMAITKPGIFDSDKVRADFEEYFPSDSFEALTRPLRIVAADLLAGQAAVFDRGPLIPAVLASAAMPVVFTPTRIGERLYADGGIVSNLPVELLEGRSTVTIASYASTLKPVEPDSLGSSLAVLRRALEIGIYRATHAKLERCDVVIQPEGLERFGVFETKELTAIENLGYEAAQRGIPAIRQALHRARHSA